MLLPDIRETHLTGLVYLNELTLRLTSRESEHTSSLDRSTTGLMIVDLM